MLGALNLIRDGITQRLMTQKDHVTDIKKFGHYSF